MSFYANKSFKNFIDSAKSRRIVDLLIKRDPWSSTSHQNEELSFIFGENLIDLGLNCCDISWNQKNRAEEFPNNNYNKTSTTTNINKKLHSSCEQANLNPN
jgi:hypothetical protein